MAMKRTAPPKAPTPKPTDLRYFRHTETGAIHAADKTWAPVMAARTDLIEVKHKESKDENDD